MGVLTLIRDGLSNVMTGAGTSADKRMHSRFTHRAITAHDVDAAYRTSWLMRKVVDLPAQDMTREWRDWQADKETIAKIEAEEKRLGLKGKVKEALTLGRLGGGAIIIGVDRDDPALSLDQATLRPLAVSYLHVMSRHHLRLGDIVRDPSDPLFGQPAYFELHGGTRIHPSRVIVFKGSHVPTMGVAQADDAYWGDPVFASMRDAITNAETAQNGFASLIDEAKLDIFGIPGMMEGLADPAYEARLMRRFDIAQQGKSTHRAIVKDAAETWEQRQVSWAGMPDVMRTYLSFVAGAADIPATRLLGKSPEGMNATGEGQERDYLTGIGSRQESELRPLLERIDAALLPSAGVNPAGLWFEFAPLFEMTEAERADMAKTKAETAKIYVDTGLVPVDALSSGVQNMLIEDATFPGLEDALTEAKAAGEADDTQEPDNVLPFRMAANDAKPRTLYVQRKLLNASELIAWAKGQGFDTTTPADEVHVTITYSRTPVDWMKMGSEDWGSDRKGTLTVSPGGARIVEALGDKGAVVLLFASLQLSWRHEEMLRNGASFDFPEYQPHVTITYAKPEGLDLATVEPFRGELRFGPEIFEELDADYQPGEA